MSLRLGIAGVLAGAIAAAPPVPPDFTPRNVVMVENADHTLTITWDVPVGGEPSSYTVAVLDAGGGFPLVGPTSLAAGTHTAANLVASSITAGSSIHADVTSVSSTGTGTSVSSNTLTYVAASAPPAPTTGATIFADDFTRSDRALVGDNGWVEARAGGGTIWNIASGLVTQANVAQVYAATPVLMHEVGGGDIVDFTVTNTRSATSGVGNLLVGAEPETTKGIYLSYDSAQVFVRVASSQAAIASTGSGVSGSPAAVWTGGSAVLRMVLTRSTRQVKVFKDGTLFFDGTVPVGVDISGHFIGLGANVAGVDT